jgi:hypothetical protein
VGLNGSRELARKFATAESFGFILGHRSRITVLDVDTPDERILADALDRHGPSPLIVRSGRGHWQGWYRHNGEPRAIRPWPDLPIDLLGGRLLVAPPSRGSIGHYEIVRGSLEDLADLPTLRNLNFAPTSVPKAANGPGAPPRASEDGTRNHDLFHACLRRAHPWSNLAALIDFARKRNEQNMPPLDDAEVVQVARNAWSYTEGKDGKTNWYMNGGRIVALPHALIDELTGDPDAFWLLANLKRYHGDREHFILARALAKSIGWTRPRFNAARDRLEDIGEIRCVTRGGRRPNDPPVYGWP